MELPKIPFFRKYSLVFKAIVIGGLIGLFYTILSDAGKEYEAEIYADGAGANYKTNPYPVTISKQKVNNKTVLNLKLAAGGGTAIKFSPIEE